MAPDAIQPNALSHQCDFARATSHLSAVKMAAHSARLPVPAARPPDPPTMVSPMFPVFRHFRLYLWGAFQRVLHRLWVAKELLSSTRVFLFLCSGYRAVAMKVGTELNSVGREGEGRPEVERGDKTSAGTQEMRGRGEQEEQEREVLKGRTMEVEEEEERAAVAEDLEGSTDDEDEDEQQVEEEESESDWMEWESDEEDENGLPQRTAPADSCAGTSLSLNSKQASDDEEEAESGDEDVSDWSDDDDDDSEASAESVELWESFLHSSDPYNPLSFSSCRPSRNSHNTHTSPAKSADTTHTSPVRETRRAEDQEEVEREDRRHSTRSVQQNKQVRFSDTVTVHPLVAWAFACKAARDGSCWMQMARDRDRFRRRVEHAGKVISPCLSPEHRCWVWERLQTQKDSAL